MGSDRCVSVRQNQNLIVASTSVHNWRDFYMAALFETDKLKLPSRIAKAERALILRARELFAMSENNSAEVKAIDKGLYAVRALQNCLGLKAGEPEAT